MAIVNNKLDNQDRQQAPKGVDLAWILVILLATAGAALLATMQLRLVMGMAAGVVAGVVVTVAAFVGLSITLHKRGRLFWIVLPIILMGYMFAGKGFAYVGVYPVFVSEVTLALGCFVVVAMILLAKSGPQLWVFTRLSALILVFFMLWGAFRTLPYLGEYGVEALRDGVIWGYAIFAFCVAMLVPADSARQIFGAYKRILPFWLLWLVVVSIASRYIAIPTWPDSTVRVIMLKGGDMGVHYAGAAAFLLLRLDRYYGKRFSQSSMWLMWMLWGLGWVFISGNRGGLLSALLGVAVVLMLRPSRSGWIRPAALITLLLAGLVMLEVLGIQLSPSDSRRQLSASQVVTGFTSVVGGPSRGDQDATVQWRLNWWQTIVDYTINGEYFWDGKGYGINIALDDGFRTIRNTNEDGAITRHPHNITMNILARSGVPGLLLWLLFLAVFGGRLLLAALSRGERGDHALWLLAYWMAFLFNAQVDVFLEGPMGGVWFWSLTGFIWVYLHATRPRRLKIAWSDESTVGNEPKRIVGVG